VKIRSKDLRSTPLGIVGRSVEVDANGYVLGLSDEEGARLLTLPGYVDEDPAPAPEVDSVPDEKPEAEPVEDKHPPVARKSPGRPKKGA
jgi:hypothetical protein